MVVLIFVVCIIASSVGAVVGAGGGVIIKPVLDALQIMPVSSLSFCSGCTVWAMSISSLLRTRNDDVKIHTKTSVLLSIGAISGGMCGKWLLDIILRKFENEATLGAIQSICLCIITFLTYLYICKNKSIPSKKTSSSIAIIVIGIVLGIISSFLGIGGGLNNVAVLFLFFSMNAKEAAKNSIYIIFFSQSANIISSIITSSVPPFSWTTIISMSAGGICGAIIGGSITKRLDNAGVEKMLKVVALLISILTFYNSTKFFLNISN